MRKSDQQMRRRDVRPAKYRSFFRPSAFIVVLGLTAACGDSTETTAGAGGTGAAGAGGGGGDAGGDSGPRDGRGPNPPAAQGSVSLHLLEIADTPAQCSPGRQWVNAPSTPGPQAQQTTGAEIGPRAVDMVGGSRVVCAVSRKSGDGFTFSADITTPRTDGANALHPTVLHFEASAVAPSGPAAEGVVTVMTESTGGNFVGEPCLFSVTPQGAASGLAVDDGKIWASVTCAMLEDPTSPGDGCQVDAGFLVFENCTH
jgi:hypothetical protein